MDPDSIATVTYVGAVVQNGFKPMWSVQFLV